jgi:hypothetical protein
MMLLSPSRSRINIASLLDDKTHQQWISLMRTNSWQDLLVRAKMLSPESS